MHVTGEDVFGAAIIDAFHEVSDIAVDGPFAVAAVGPIVRGSSGRIFDTRGFVEFTVVALGGNGDVGGDDGVFAEISLETVVNAGGAFESTV